MQLSVPQREKYKGELLSIMDLDNKTTETWIRSADVSS